MAAIKPLVAPAGTVTLIEIGVSMVNVVAATPLKVTEVTPVIPVPVRVTTVPTGPDGGVMPLIAGIVAMTP